MPKKEYNTKTEIEGLISSYIDKKFDKHFKEFVKKKPTFEKEVRNISVEVLDDLYRLLWVKKNIWKNGIKK